MFTAYIQEVNLKIYNFQFILLTLFRTPRLHRKFQLHDLWSCALSWLRQKHHLTTHISYFNTSLTTFLFTQLAIHTRHRHEPRNT